MEEKIKTGTTTLAIKYNDGIITAADRRVTMGHLIAAEDGYEKIYQIAPHVAVTMAGGVASAQQLTRLIRAELRLAKLRVQRDATVEEAAQLVTTLLYRTAQHYGMAAVHFLISGYDRDGFHIYDATPDGTVMKRSNYATSGSGSIFVMGVLDQDYQENMNEQQALDLTKKSLRAAMTRDSASGNGADIYKVTSEGVIKLDQITVDYALPRQ